MTRPNSVRGMGWVKRYETWRKLHPSAIPRKEIERLIDEGDQFGRKVPIGVLADLAATNKNTFSKWLAVREDEKKADKDLTYMRQLIDKEPRRKL